MRKTAVFIAASIVIASCSNRTESEPELILNSPSSISFGYEGGLGAISYKVTGTDDDPDVTAISTEDWIGDITVSERAVTFIVSVNDKTESRNGKIVLAYDNREIAVAIGQDARGYDYMFEAEAFAGTYYGTRYSDVPNYYLCLTEKEEGGVNDNGFYCIDLYSRAPEDMESITLPHGVYAFDAGDTFAEGTFSSSYSYYSRSAQNGNGGNDGMIPFRNGTLTVDDGTMILDAISIDGKYHHITFEGDAFFSDESEECAPFFSTLTEDCTLDLSGASMVAEYHHNFYCDWEANWLLYLTPDDGTGDMLMFDIVTDELSMERGIDDVYQGVLTFSAHSFVPGLMENWGSWYYRYQDGRKSDIQAPLMGGTLEIIKNDDGTHTLLLTAYDDAPVPNTITARWNGVVDMVDKRH